MQTAFASRQQQLSFICHFHLGISAWGLIVKRAIKFDCPLIAAYEKKTA